MSHMKINFSVDYQHYRTWIRQDKANVPRLTVEGFFPSLLYDIKT